jgi:hypothetical protein
VVPAVETAQGARTADIAPNRSAALSTGAFTERVIGGLAVGARPN